MSPQGDDRPPKRPEGSGGGGKPDEPNKPGASGDQGKPEKSIWVGVKLANRRTIEISAFRCSSCGFLETYARQ
ncbi:MAG: hypothetical protein ACHQCI_05465 [Solirubrobacterales bacterium]